MSGLPVAAVGRILKNVGADRISNDGKIALVEALEYKCNDIVKKSVDHAPHGAVKQSNLKILN